MPGGVIQSLLILLAMGMATPQSTYRKPERETHTARLGDFQVTVTASGAVSSNFAQQHRIAPRPGSHFVVVKLKFKNLASYFSCPVLEGLGSR